MVLPALTGAKVSLKCPRATEPLAPESRRGDNTVRHPSPLGSRGTTENFTNMTLADANTSELIRIHLPAERKYLPPSFRYDLSIPPYSP